MAAALAFCFVYLYLSNDLNGASFPRRDGTNKMLDEYRAALATCCAKLSTPVSERGPYMSIGGAGPIV